MKNRFGTLLQDIQNSEEIPLSNIDLLRLTNNETKILMYNQLAFMSASDFLSLFEVENKFNIIVLYEFIDGGHWVTVTFHEKTNSFNFFDPYGMNYDYVSNKVLKEGIQPIHFGRLFRECGFPVYVNKFRFQQFLEDVNTCGRWAAIRSIYWYMDNDEFKDYFLKTKPEELIKTLDDLVTIMTMIPLDYVTDADEKLVNS
jgi:hypothetical protein